MNWEEFLRECGPLYAKAMGALSTFRMKVQHVCIDALEAHREQLCELVGLNSEDVQTKGYAEPDKIPGSPPAYYCLGSRLRAGESTLAWLYLNYWPDGRTILVYQFAQNDQAKQAALVEKVNALRRLEFSGELWTFEATEEGPDFSLELEQEHFSRLPALAKELCETAHKVLGRVADVEVLLN